MTHDVTLPPKTTTPPSFIHRLVHRIRNPNRVQKWAQFGSFFVAIFGLFGLTLTGLVGSEWLIFAIVPAVVVFGWLTIFVPLADLDVYTDKTEVDWVWDEVIRSATDSVDIVAGDLSWLRDNRCLDLVLAALRSKGCTIRVICKAPERHTERRENIAALLAGGIEVRALPKEHRPTPSSAIAVVDHHNLRDIVVCRIRTAKKPGALTDSYSGISNPDSTEYWAKRELAVRDEEQISSSLALVKAYWSCSQPVVLIEELPSDVATSAIVLAALRCVPTYRLIRDTDVQTRTIKIRDLFSWCLREDKLEGTSILVKQMVEQNVPMFAPSLVWSNNRATILLHPIVEYHNNKPVVFDGVHRLWHMYRDDPNASAQVLVINCDTPLPGTPECFERLPYYRGKLNRHADFRLYKEEYWRSFTPMEQYLADEGKKKLSDHHLRFPRLE